MAASFTHSGGSCSFSRAIPRPVRSLQVIQPQRATAAQVRYGYTHTIINDSIAIELRMTTAEKDALLTFFRSVVNGMASPFTYSAPDGGSYSVRFASGALSGLREKGPDTWIVTLALLILPGAWQFSDGSTQLYSDGTEVTYA